MTRFTPYRQIVAVFLLAVYAFIAAPAQLWHHHKYNPEPASETISADTKSSTISKGATTSFETNCPICSHKYSTCNNDAFVPFITSVIVMEPKWGCYALPLIALTYFHLPNKGPPALS